MKKGTRAISSIFKGGKAIDKIIKGTLVVYESFKKLLANGVPPLTLFKCKRANLVDYKIYGESVQEGENLFDINSSEILYKAVYGTWKKTENGYIATCTNSSSPAYRMQVLIPMTNFKVGEKYTINCVTENVSTIRIGECNNENDTSTYTKFGTFSSRPFTFNINEITKPYLSIAFYGSTHELGDEIKISNLHIQNSKPAPDNPIEIQSVGDKTKNVFNYRKIASRVESNGIEYVNNNDGTFTTNGTLTSNASSLLLNGGISLNSFKIGETYHISSGVELKTTDKRYYMITTIKNNVTNANRYIASDTTGTTFTLLENETVATVQFRIYAPTNEMFEVSNLVVKPMVCKASEYNGFDVYGKYKIPVKVTGKNLVNQLLKGYMGSGASFGTMYDASKEIYKTIHLQNLKAGTYTFSFENPVNVTRVVSTNFHDEHVSISTTPQMNTSYCTVALIQDEEDFYFSFRNAISSTTEWGNAWVQAEIGQNVTEYEPYVEPMTTNIYLDEPLKKIGDYVDYIDFENQKVVRRINKYEITGNESNWHDRDLIYASYGIVFRNTKLFSDTANFDVKDAYCTNFEYGGIGNKKGVFSIAQSGTDWQFNISDGQLGISKDEDASVRLQKWLEWLQGNYNNGTPVTVFYVLQDEKSNNIELPNISTIKGTTIIEVDTVITPSNMEVTYLSNNKPNVQTLNETDNAILNEIVAMNTDTYLDITESEINQILDEIIGG